MSRRLPLQLGPRTGLGARRNYHPEARTKTTTPASAPTTYRARASLDPGPKWKMLVKTKLRSTRARSSQTNVRMATPGPPPPQSNTQKPRTACTIGNSQQARERLSSSLLLTPRNGNHVPPLSLKASSVGASTAISRFGMVAGT